MNGDSAMTTMCGTLSQVSSVSLIYNNYLPLALYRYAAPEIIRGEAEGYDNAVDMWSLGVLLYVMLTGEQQSAVTLIPH